MLPIKKRIVFVVAFVSFFGCGKEIGRVSFVVSGTVDATMTLKAGEVDFWTDIDLLWEGSAMLDYQVTFDQGGKTVVMVMCDPFGQFNVRQMWIEMNFGVSYFRCGRGKMSCSMSFVMGGPMIVKVIFVWGGKSFIEML